MAANGGTAAKGGVLQAGSDRLAAKRRSASPTVAALGRLVRNPTGVIGLAGVTIMVVAAVGADVLAPWVAIPQSHIFYTVYDTLVERDLKGRFTPGLAKSWKFSQDGKSVTFDLQEGVKFHSGNEFTAEAIEPAFKYLQKEGSPYHMWMKDIVKYEVLGKYQVRLTLKQPVSPILTLLDMAQIPDPSLDVRGLKGKGIGTGPFRVAEWRQGDVLRLTRNENYWRKNLPILDEIECKVWPDRAAMLAALESGHADIAFNPPFQDMPRLSKSKDLQVATVPAMCLDVKMNVTKKPYDSKKVRQGIAWACDRQRFVDAYLFGFGEVWETPLPEGSIGYADDLKGRIGYDLNKAKRLIAEGGYPNGFESAVMIGPDARAPGMPTMAEILQADLKKIGVTLKIEQVEAQVCNDRWVAGKYDMSIHSYGRLKEPGEVFQAMVWRKENPEQFRAPEYGKLIDDGMATLDEKKKQEIYHRLYEIILDECFCIPVAAVPRTIAYRKHVMDFDWSADGYIRATNMWLDKA